VVPTLNAISSLKMPPPTFPELAAAKAPKATLKTIEDPKLRAKVGEFVGNVFYGTLLKQMQDSKLKGKYFHGGHGEDVFKGQLNMELAKRMGQSKNDPIANQMYDAFVRSAEGTRPKADKPAVTQLEAPGQLRAYELKKD
jgi:hypothetical protein